MRYPTRRLSISHNCEYQADTKEGGNGPATSVMPVESREMQLLSCSPAPDLKSRFTPGNWPSAVWICLSAGLLLWPALLNGYPLVFSDTGTYLG